MDGSQTKNEWLADVLGRPPARPPAAGDNDEPTTKS